MTRPSLVEVSTSTLELLREAIASARIPLPIGRAGLLGIGIRHHAEALEAVLGGHSRHAAMAIIDASLDERRHQTRPAPELVWTGPDRHGSTARDTAVVLRELFERAQHRVILAGYSFSNAKTLLEPLHRAMVERAVDVRFFVHIEQAKRLHDPPEAYADEALARFRADQWPFAGPCPRLYYDRRALTPGPPWSKLHAKCVVVDDRHAFVSSANFTYSGQEQNIEVGVLLDDPIFAEHLANQWMRLIEADSVSEWGA